MTMITGTGACIPDLMISNSSFLQNIFFESNGTKINRANENIIDKFSAITGIKERRYAGSHQLASDLGFLAAQEAIQDSSIDRETIDYIIVAHNFGDVMPDTNRVNALPSLASKIKAHLKIANPDCVAYDLTFGCPGWVEGLIQANYYLKSGDAKRCLVIGTETLSRVIDPHDRDSMIFSDGAGAVILESSPSKNVGVLSHKTQTCAVEHYDHIKMDSSNSLKNGDSNLYLKMNGRKVYEFALNHVPPVIKTALDKANLHITDIQKILIHQANEKMDHAIAERLFGLYGINEISSAIMPMTIGFLGNSSVATVPTLLDLMLKGKLKDHEIHAGDKIVLASVGAGMNINAVVYGF
jgi:3-oxoacyl-[acyl-carrier-protein] synthase III